MRRTGSYLNFAIAICLFSISCNPYKEDASLLGHWYSFNDDTLYQEICITDSTFLFYYENIEFFGPFKYELSHDSIVFLFYKNGKWMERNYRPRIVFVDTNEFLLEYKNELNLYKRIREGSLLLDNFIADSMYYKYVYEFEKRKRKHLYSAGFDIDTSLHFFSIEESDFLNETPFH